MRGLRSATATGGQKNPVANMLVTWKYMVAFTSVGTIPDRGGSRFRGCAGRPYYFVLFRKVVRATVCIVGSGSFEGLLLRLADGSLRTAAGPRGTVFRRAGRSAAVPSGRLRRLALSGKWSRERVFPGESAGGLTGTRIMLTFVRTYCVEFKRKLT